MAAQNITRALTSTKDRGRSRYPYYTETYAAEVKATVLMVLETGEPMLWPADVVTHHTLYAKWKQGSDYLITHEPEFAEVWRAVVASAIPRQGVKVSPRRGAHVPTAVVIREWRPEFLKFLEHARHRDKFERVLHLSDDDIRWIEEQLEPIKELFLASITNDQLTLIRYDRNPTAGPADAGESSSV